MRHEQTTKFTRYLSWHIAKGLGAGALLIFTLLYCIAFAGAVMGSVGNKAYVTPLFVQAT